MYQLKYLYAEHIYGWGAEQLSWYISYLGGMRAISLLLVLPCELCVFYGVLQLKKFSPFFIIIDLIGVFKPKAVDSTSSSQKGKGKAAPIGGGPSSSTSEEEDGGVQVISKHKPTRKQLGQEIAFDLLLARCSFLMDIISNVLIVASPAPTFRHTSIGGSNNIGVEGGEKKKTMLFGRSQGLFVVASGMASFGGGAGPAIHSLTLCILQARELSNSVEGGGGEALAAETGGKGVSGNLGGLFGAFAFLQSIGSMILGVRVVLIDVAQSTNSC